MDLDFTAFIAALEGEFARRQTTRKVEAVDRAILVRVETKPFFDSEASLAELRELCRTAGVEVFDAVIQHRPEVDPRYPHRQGKALRPRHPGAADGREPPRSSTTS